MKHTLRGIILHIVLCAWLFGVGQLNAQSLNGACETQFDWTKLPAKSGRSAGVCITHDAQNNIYVAGTFENQIKIGNHLLTGAGKKDIFIAKYNPNGEVLWVQSAGGKEDDNVYFFVSLSDDKISLIGETSESIYFSDKVYSKQSEPHGIFNAEFGLDGKLIEVSYSAISPLVIELPLNRTFSNNNRWELSFSENPSFNHFNLSNDNLGWKLDGKADSLTRYETLGERNSDVLYLAGGFKGTLQLGETALTAYGEEDGFIIGVNKEGKVTLARHLGGKKDDAITGITVLDNGQIFITGYTTSNTQFGHLNVSTNVSDTVPVFFLSRLSCGLDASCAKPEEVMIDKITENSLTVKWEETAETQAYDLQYKGTKENVWQTRRTLNSPFVIENLTAGENYQVRVRKVCAEGFSPFSQELEARTYYPLITCQAPRDFSIRAVHPTHATVQWFEKGNSSAIEEYQIFYRKKGQKPWLISHSAQNSFKLEGLEPITEYEVKVSVTCKNNFNADTTLVRTFSTIRLDACAPPHEVSAVHVLHRSAHIRWASESQATNYRVQWKAVGKTDWQSANTSLNGIVLFGLNPNTGYEVRLRSKCAENSYSPYSDPITFKTLKECEPSGTLLVPDVTLTTAWVVWDSVPNGKRYELFYKPKQDIYWKNVATTNRYTQLTGLNPDTRYEIKLRVNCGDTVASAFGVVTELNTLPGHACGSVENVVILPAVDHAIIRWKPAKLAGGYILQWRCTSTNLPWNTVTLKDPQAKQYIIPNLTSGATYAIKIITQCESVLQTFERTFSTKTDVQASVSMDANALNAFPNPAKDKLRVEYNIGKEEHATLEIYDLVGRKVFSQTINRFTGAIDLNVNDWQAGVYFCRLYIDEDKNYIQKIAVTR